MRVAMEPTQPGALGSQRLTGLRQGLRVVGQQQAESHAGAWRPLVGAGHRGCGEDGCQHGPVGLGEVGVGLLGALHLPIGGSGPLRGQSGDLQVSAGGQVGQRHEHIAHVGASVQQGARQAGLHAGGRLVVGRGRDESRIDVGQGLVGTVATSGDRVDRRTEDDDDHAEYEHDQFCLAHANPSCPKD